eukprot:357579-Chlamydomonas_euryale.AAC.2
MPGRLCVLITRMFHSAWVAGARVAGARVAGRCRTRVLQGADGRVSNRVLQTPSPPTPASWPCLWTRVWVCAAYLVP